LPPEEIGIDSGGGALGRPEHYEALAAVRFHHVRRNGNFNRAPLAPGPPMFHFAFRPLRAIAFCREHAVHAISDFYHVNPQTQGLVAGGYYAVVPYFVKQ
jgi:hypothetical protein